MMGAPRKRVPHRVGLMIVAVVAGHIWCVSSITSNPAHYPNPSGFVQTLYYCASCYYRYCCRVFSFHYFRCHGENPSSVAGNKSRPYRSDPDAMNEMRVRAIQQTSREICSFLPPFVTMTITTPVSSKISVARREIKMPNVFRWSIATCVSRLRSDAREFVFVFEFRPS